MTLQEKMYGSHKHSGIHMKTLGHYNGPVKRMGTYTNPVRKLGHYNKSGSGKNNLIMEMMPRY